MTGKISGTNRDLGSGWGGNEGKNGCGNNISRRHAAQGAETCGISWKVAGVGNFQVDVAPLWKRRWGVGETERCGNDEQVLMGGGGRMEERTKNDPEMSEKGGAGGLE